MKRTLLLMAAGAVLGAALVCAIGFSDSSVRDSTRARFVAVDETLFGGAVRRAYRGQSLPSPPARSAVAGSYEWLDREPFTAIAHGLGPSWVGGPNTLSTLTYAYATGFRVFEVDMVLTSDGRLVCLHGSGERSLQRFTYGDYLRLVEAQGLEPCEFSDLLAIADSLPDVWFVIDAKNRFSELYAEMKRHASRGGSLKAFIPQIFAFEQVAELRKEPYFAGEIFTSYRSALTTAQILDYAPRFGVKVVTLTIDRARGMEHSPPDGVAVFTHPVEVPEEAVRLRQRGFRGVYTTSLGPRTHPLLYAEWKDGCVSDHILPCLNDVARLTETRGSATVDDR